MNIIIMKIKIIDQLYEIQYYLIVLICVQVVKIKKNNR